MFVFVLFCLFSLSSNMFLLWNQANDAVLKWGGYFSPIFLENHVIVGFFFLYYLAPHGFLFSLLKSRNRVTLAFCLTCSVWILLTFVLTSWNSVTNNCNDQLTKRKEFFGSYDLGASSQCLAHCFGSVMPHCRSILPGSQRRRKRTRTYNSISGHIINDQKRSH